MANDVHVMGVGMVPFTKPGRGDPYDVMGAAAARAALDDAAVDYRQVQQAYAGFVYADTCAGQLALYPLGLSGIPIINVNNACATGSTALFLARQAVASGAAECVLALGFEQMNPGGLGLVFQDRPSSAGLFRAELERTHGYDRSQIATPQYQRPRPGSTWRSSASGPTCLAASASRPGVMARRTRWPFSATSSRWSR